MDATVLEDIGAEKPAVLAAGPEKISLKDEPVLMGDLRRSVVPLHDYFRDIVDLLHFDIREFKDLEVARRGLVYTDSVSGYTFTFHAKVTRADALNKDIVPTPHFIITCPRLGSPAMFSIYRHPLEGQINNRHQPTPWKLGIANFGDKNVSDVLPVTEVELQQKFLKWMMTNLGQAHPDFMDKFIQMAVNTRRPLAAGHNWADRIALLKMPEKIQAEECPIMPASLHKKFNARATFGKLLQTIAKWIGFKPAGMKQHI